MEELKLEFVKLFVLFRTHKFNPPVLQAISGSIDLPSAKFATTPINLKESKISFGNWEAETVKPGETFYHIDRQKALAHKEELETNTVPNYDTQVELSEYVGLTDEEGKTARIVSSWKAYTLC